MISTSGVNGLETARDIVGGGGIVKHLLTVIVEGTYTLKDLVVMKPLIFIMQEMDPEASRIPIMFLSGCDFQSSPPGSYIYLRCRDGMAAPGFSFVAIPTADTVTFKINCNEAGVGGPLNKPGNARKLHIFQ